MARTPQQRLAAYDDRYRRLAAQLAEIGPISAGSLTRRYMGGPAFSGQWIGGPLCCPVAGNI